jgi:hypothetical protein
MPVVMMMMMIIVLNGALSSVIYSCNGNKDQLGFHRICVRWFTGQVAAHHKRILLTLFHRLSSHYLKGDVTFLDAISRGLDTDSPYAAKGKH